LRRFPDNAGLVGRVGQIPQLRFGGEELQSVIDVATIESRNRTHRDLEVLVRHLQLG
jgi:hypothetical protein